MGWWGRGGGFSCRGPFGKVLTGDERASQPPPTTTAIIDYGIDFGNLSANGNFFVGAQTAIRL